MGLIPGPEARIPHAAGQLSTWATTAEADVPRACALQQEKAPQWETRAPHLESSFCSPQLEEARAQQLKSSTHKNK